MRVWFGVAFVLLFLACGAATAGVATVYSFCSQKQCKDGSAPQAPLTLAAIGTLYGTTSSGGAGNAGTVFSLTENEDGSWTRTTLYMFCRKGNCPDGANPAGPVVADKEGNLYGIAPHGGDQNGGVVFELSSGGRLTVLYNFPEATQPRPPLTYAGQRYGELYDGVSPLFGLEKSGGAFGQGAAFRLSPPAAGKNKWKFDTIYSFCSKTNCVDGAAPSVLLTTTTGSDALVGATEGGGKKSAGTVFTLSADGRKWKEEVQHHFCTMHNCADGARPNSLLIESTGLLAGTTSSGGNAQCDGAGCGVLFQLSYGGFQTSFGVAHTFCSEADCADGANPGGLSTGSGGTIFGATSNGGDPADVEQGGGTLFAANSGAFTTVYAFCAAQGCSDGANPATAPTLVDFKGNMFGATQNGGASGQGGTIYELTP